MNTLQVTKNVALCLLILALIFQISKLACNHIEPFDNMFATKCKQLASKFEESQKRLLTDLDVSNNDHTLWLKEYQDNKGSQEYILGMQKKVDTITKLSHEDEDSLRLKILFWNKFYSKFNLIEDYLKNIILKEYCGNDALKTTDVDILAKYMVPFTSLGIQLPVYTFDVYISHINDIVVPPGTTMLATKFTLKCNVATEDRTINSLISRALRIRFAKWDHIKGFGNEVSRQFVGDFRQDLIKSSVFRSYTYSMKSDSVLLRAGNNTLQIIKSDEDDEVKAYKKSLTSSKLLDDLKQNIKNIVNIKVRRRNLFMVTDVSHDRDRMKIKINIQNNVFIARVRRGKHFRVIEKKTDNPITKFVYIVAQRVYNGHVELQLNDNVLSELGPTLHIELKRDDRKVFLHPKCKDISTLGFPEEYCTKGITIPVPDVDKSMIDMDNEIRNVKDCAIACKNEHSCQSMYFDTASNNCRMFVNSLGNFNNSNVQHIDWKFDTNGIVAEKPPNANRGNMCQKYLGDMSSSFNDCKIRSISSADPKYISRIFQGLSLHGCAEKCNDDVKCNSFGHVGNTMQSKTKCFLYKEKFDTNVIRSQTTALNINERHFTGVFSQVLSISDKTGRTWKIDGSDRSIVRLNSGKEVQFNVIEDKDGFKGQYGRVKLSVHGSPTISLRHSAWKIFCNTHIQNNNDFTWYFRDSDEAGLYDIVNENATYIGYRLDQDNLILVERSRWTDPRRNESNNLMSWKLNPKPTTSRCAAKRHIRELDFHSNGLVGEFYAENYSTTDRIWRNASGLVHVTEIAGTIKMEMDTQTGKAYISGDTTTGLIFPEVYMKTKEYTLLYVAKYNGANRQRIFDGLSRDTSYWINWLSGFWGGRVGVAHHEYWLTPEASFMDNRLAWMIGADQYNLFRVNGVQRSTSIDDALVKDPILSINKGVIRTGMPMGEESDWAVSCVLIYDRKLSQNEIANVEYLLFNHYQLKSTLDCTNLSWTQGASDKTVMRTCMGQGAKVMGKFTLDVKHGGVHHAPKNLKECADVCHRQGSCDIATMVNTNNEMICKTYQSDMPWTLSDNEHELLEYYIKAEPTKFNMMAPV